MLPPRFTYPSDYNCRSFYRCSNTGTSVPMCCNAFYKYDHATGSCQPDSSCSIDCTKRELPETDPSVRLSMTLLLYGERTYQRKWKIKLDGKWRIRTVIFRNWNLSNLPCSVNKRLHWKPWWSTDMLNQWVTCMWLALLARFKKNISYCCHLDFRFQQKSANMTMWYSSLRTQLLFLPML